MMTNRAPLIITAVSCLAVGLGIGWTLKPAGMRVTESENTSTPKTSTESVTENQRAVSHDHAPDASDVDSTESAVAERMQRKREMLESLRARGRMLFFTPFVGKLITPEFAMLMDLTANEVVALEAALAKAKDSYAEAEFRAGSVTIGPDGRSLTMEVPPMPEAGGAIYDHALATFESVLGPERFELFNIASRDAFDRALDNFGLSQVTYSLKVSDSTMPSGELLFDIERSHVGPGGRGTSSSRLRPKDMDAFFPQLSKVMPKDFGKNTTK